MGKWTKGPWNDWTYPCPEKDRQLYNLSLATDLNSEKFVQKNVVRGIFLICNSKNILSSEVRSQMHPVGWEMTCKMP